MFLRASVVNRVCRPAWFTSTLHFALVVCERSRIHNITPSFR